MALGWGAMSGAAINILLAPWFERRRGFGAPSSEQVRRSIEAARKTLGR